MRHGPCSVKNNLICRQQSLETSDGKNKNRWSVHEEWDSETRNVGIVRGTLLTLTSTFSRTLSPISLTSIQRPEVKNDFSVSID